MADWYHLISFTIVSLFLICLITRPKARHVSSADRQESSMAVQKRSMGSANKGVSRGVRIHDHAEALFYQCIYL